MEIELNAKDTLKHNDIEEKTEEEINSHEEVDSEKQETCDTLSKKKTQQDRMLGFKQAHLVGQNGSANR